jgi:hypothetical protein
LSRQELGTIGPADSLFFSFHYPESSMPQQPAHYWVAFSVRFFFGAILGLLFGFRVAAWNFDGGAGAWAWVSGSAVLFGAAAGYWGDAFWHNLRDWLGR